MSKRFFRESQTLQFLEHIRFHELAPRRRSRAALFRAIASAGADGIEAHNFLGAGFRRRNAEAARVAVGVEHAALPWPAPP